MLILFSMILRISDLNDCFYDIEDSLLMIVSRY